MTNVDSKFLGGYVGKSGVPIEGHDRNKIDEMIKEASKGSKFYEYQQRRERRISERVDSLRIKKAELEKDEDLLRRTAEEMDEWLREVEEKRPLDRTYLHIDMDAFFAAVETLKHPEYANIPVAVGGESMLSTANYVARKYGVVSAMPGYIARKLCPELLIVVPDSAAYRKASAEVQLVLREYDLQANCFSLDEASLDITDHLQRLRKTAEETSEELRQKVFERTKLTCSVGVGPSRQLAKICSNINKPNGQFILPLERAAILEFIKRQPVKRINGVGNVMSKVLEDVLEIRKCEDIIKNITWVRLLFSEIQSEFLLLSALGLGGTFGESVYGERKSMSVERTFKRVTLLSDMQDILQKLCVQLAEDLCEEELAGKTVGIKMKTTTFDVITRAVTLEMPISEADDIYKHASKLLSKNRPVDLRLLGVRLAGLVAKEDSPKYRTLDDFAPESSVTRADCPICGNQIDCHPDDTIRINEHIDKCLGSPPSNTTESIKKPRITLDAFIAKKS